MSNTSKVQEKIAALLKKTTSNGASEAEAMSAMKHAAKLMKEHGVTMQDIKEKNAASIDFVVKHVNEGDKYLNIFDRVVSSAIMKYTDTRGWNDKRIKGTSRLMFFGYRVDVELAEYIRKVCLMALDYEWKMFSRTIPTGNRHASRKDFQIGMALRLKERLLALKETNEETSDSRELVVIKTEIVTSMYNAMNMKLRSAGKNYFNANSAFEAGKSAADNVRFNQEVQDGPQGKVMLIA